MTTPFPGPLSGGLSQRKVKAVPDGIGTTFPFYAHSAGGGIVVDVDGNSLIDFGSGIAVTTVGNSARKVVEAVIDQAQNFTHTCFMVTPYELYVEVAETLNRLTPGEHDKRTALFNTGAEAIENAVKIARSFTKRQAVVAFDHAFHGRTSLTMAMTARAVPYKSGFGPFAPEVYRAPGSYPYRDLGLSGDEAARRTIEIIEKQVGAENLAALVIEPIQGEGGFIVPAPGFLPALVQWCRANGVVFIADEIQTGLSRTGDMFACEHENVVPDILVTAKSLAGGLPLSGVTGRAEMMNSVRAGGLGGTYGGNPIACAAALAVFETIEEENLCARAVQIGDHVTSKLMQMQRVDPRIGEVRGRGGMVAIELVKDTNRTPDPARTSAIAAEAMAQGLMVLTCGTYSNVVRLLPPLSMPDELLDQGLDILETVLERTR